ncbi:UDPGT domain-containing protein [Cephalotus follicularis]|uniref:Glycosyltransferase n=1 Tax=Cephalotus follicularis TaxID=3775 RepID=A0A1Q3DJ21_CEPFO|nr:UDPGT domain-containing protein [Cephalotus follicularis]
MQPTKPHAALLASPGMGHLIPVLELGNRLVSNYGFNVTIFVLQADDSTAQSQFLKSLHPTLLNIVSLPSVDISSLVAPDAQVAAKVAVMMRESLPALRSTINSMNFRPTALIVDLFGTEALAIANEYDMLKYVLIASNAWFLAATIFFPTLNRKEEDEIIKQKQALKIPGCKPVRFDDTLEAFLDRKNQGYDEYVRVGLEIPMADGILVNTWEDLEPTTLKALRDSKLLGRVTRVPVYPIGPLTRSVKPQVLGNQLMDWLNMQPLQSVIYISFGSGGTLSANQTTELAWGLELSKQRFIWVVRPPMDDDVSGAFFDVGNGHDGTPTYLPDGFVSRTKNVGRLVPMWAPQAEILSHSSIGGFLSHCGWNSTLESIVNGVPMIAWPLFSEQHMNATMLTEELGVAVRSEELPSKRILGREEIGKMVRKIMVYKEGHGIRNRVKELKYSASKALSIGDSSFNSLSQVANDVNSGLQFLKSMPQGA